MKLLCRATLVAIVTLAIARPAAASSIQILIGDKDWFGTGLSGKSPGDTASFTDDALNDNRSTGESTSTDGAQLTDIYSALYPVPTGCTTPTANPSCTPNGATGFAAFALTDFVLESGSVTILIGGFQSDTWGPIAVDINGVSVDFSFEDGYQATSLRILTLTQAMIDAANAAGELRINFDHSVVRPNPGDPGSLDYIAFDYFQLDAQGTPVPEPGTLALVGLGLAGSAQAVRRRRRRPRA